MINMIKVSAKWLNITSGHMLNVCKQQFQCNLFFSIAMTVIAIHLANCFKDLHMKCMVGVNDFSDLK